MKVGGTCTEYVLVRMVTVQNSREAMDVEVGMCTTDSSMIVYILTGSPLVELFCFTVFWLS